MDDSTQTIRLGRRYFDDGSEEGFDAAGAGQSLGRRWRHTDLIGTTIAETDASGTPVARRASTAFGEHLEPVGGAADIDSRYGYAGDWGYEGA